MPVSIAHTLYQFMQRVKLKGAEVPAFVQSMQFIEGVLRQAELDAQSSNLSD